MLKDPLDQDITFSKSLSSSLYADPHLGVEMTKVAMDLHEMRKATKSMRSGISFYYEDDKLGYNQAGTSAWLGHNNELLRDESTPAGVLILALKNVLGPGVMVWEPDTIWMELERKTGDVPLVNRDKIMAAITLSEMPAFYWEVNTFRNTVMCFNDTRTNIDIVQEATPGELAWAVYEAELILQEAQQWEPEFDYEPRIYTAEVLHRHGFVVPPEILSFAKDELSARNVPDVDRLSKTVQEKWAKLDKSDLRNHPFKETPVDVQLAKLAAVNVYMEDRVENYKKKLSKLTRTG